MRLALTLALLTASSSVAASPAEEVRVHDAAARAAYADRRYADALEAFLDAFALNPSPRLLYNVALCAQLSGHADLAWTAFDAYLSSEDPDLTRRAEARRRFAQVRRAVVLVEVVSVPPGARVFVEGDDAEPLGATPLRAPLRPGVSTLRLEREGSETTTRRVTGRAGEQVSLRVELPEVSP